MSAWRELINYIGDDEDAMGILLEALNEKRAEQTRRDALRLCKWADEETMRPAERLAIRNAADVLYASATIEWDEGRPA